MQNSNTIINSDIDGADDLKRAFSIFCKIKSLEEEILSLKLESVFYKEEMLEIEDMIHRGKDGYYLISDMEDSHIINLFKMFHRSGKSLSSIDFKYIREVKKRDMVLDVVKYWGKDEDYELGSMLVS